MNLALEKGQRVTTGGKGRGEIGGEAGEVTGVVPDSPTTDGLVKRYGTFIGWGMTAGKVEVLLVVGGFDVDGGAEIKLVKDVNIQEGDMERGDGPGKSDRIATIEALKEEEKGIMNTSPQQEDIINKPEPKVRSSEFKKSSSRDPMKRLA